MLPSETGSSVRNRERLDALLDVAGEIRREREFVCSDSEYDRGRMAALNTMTTIVRCLLLNAVE